VTPGRSRWDRSSVAGALKPRGATPGRARLDARPVASSVAGALIHCELKKKAKGAHHSVSGQSPRSMSEKVSMIIG
jgi:hypothetical protein